MREKNQQNNSRIVGRIWNALPCDEVDFSSLRRFRNSLTVKVLDY